GWGEQGEIRGRQRREETIGTSDDLGGLGRYSKAIDQHRSSPPWKCPLLLPDEIPTTGNPASIATARRTDDSLGPERFHSDLIQSSVPKNQLNQIDACSGRGAHSKQFGFSA